jgi:hypothetical protein
VLASQIGLLNHAALEVEWRLLVVEDSTFAGLSALAID